MMCGEAKGGLVHPNGIMCVSRGWLLVHAPETILLTMLSSPKDEDPASLEAAKQWRNGPQAF